MFDQTWSPDSTPCVDVDQLRAGDAISVRPTMRPTAEHGGSGMPGWIWRTMLGAYAVFFGGLFLATGRDSASIFVLVISIGYTIVYFGTARVLLEVNPAPSPDRFERGLGDMQTWTGPMSRGAVAAQVLTVPLCLALFGLAIVFIRNTVG